MQLMGLRRVEGGRRLCMLHVNDRVVHDSSAHGGVSMEDRLCTW